MDTDDLLTAEQAAELIGNTPGTVRAAMTKGRLPCVKMFGRRLIKYADALAYKQRSEQNGQRPRGRPKSTPDA